MKNLVKTGLIALFALGAGVAMAAANVTFLTLDSAANATVEAGDNVSAKVTYDITGDAPDVESLSWEVVGSGLPETCVNVADRLNSGTFTSTFDVNTAGATEGTWDVKIRIYGVDGAGTDNNCGGTINDSMNFTNRLTITENANDAGSVINNTGSGNHGTNSGNDEPSWLEGFFAHLMAVMKPATTTATVTLPATPTACATLALKMTGTVPGVYNNNNTILQGFLIGEGMSIPWLTDPKLSAGVPFGFFGQQTSLALSTYKTMHGCI